MFKELLERVNALKATLTPEQLRVHDSVVLGLMQAGIDYKDSYAAMRVLADSQELVLREMGGIPVEEKKTGEEAAKEIMAGLTEQEQGIFASLGIACRIAMPGQEGFMATLNAVEALGKIMRLVVEEEEAKES